MGPLAVAVTVVTWAAAFPAIRVGLNGFGPASLGFGRLVVAAAALGAVAVVIRPKVPPRPLWGRVILAGFLGQTLYQLLLMVGEHRVPAGTASILIAMAPLFSVVAASVLLHESARGQWPGMLLAVIGAIIVGASLDLGGGTYILAVLAAAACQGLYHVVVKPLSQAVGAFGATAWSVWAGALLSVPAAPWLLSDTTSAPANALVAVAFLGIVPSALGYVTWSFALARAPVAQTTSALYLVPVVALAVSWIWLGERPAVLAVLGGAVAISGVIVVRRGGSPSPVVGAGRIQSRTKPCRGRGKQARDALRELLLARALLAAELTNALPAAPCPSSRRLSAGSAASIQRGLVVPVYLRPALDDNLVLWIGNQRKRAAALTSARTSRSERCRSCGRTQAA
jgi:drug/metabolite transporter (DMT)-like permease